MIVTPIKHKPIHKPVWDVHTNGNIFPGLTVWDVHKNGNVFPGLTVCDIHTNRNVFLGFTVWDVHTYGNDFWDSPCGMYIPTEMIGFRCLARSHTSSFCPSLCARRAYPLLFLGCVGRIPLSPTLTWRRFRMPSRKGVKNRLFRTDAYQCRHEPIE